jgi:hypothetical protein
MLSKEDSRYPYTYAADYLRGEVGHDNGKLISRAAAAVMVDRASKALGIDSSILANALADRYIAKENENGSV